MAVYVDDARISFRGQRWSHMVAESAEELHRAAEALGLRREWVQDRGRTLHYDLPDAWRRRAIEERIATPIAWRDLVRRRRHVASGRAVSRVRQAREPSATGATWTAVCAPRENSPTTRLGS